jgi:hypothetical protein
MKYLDRLNQTAEETAQTNNVLIAEEKHLDIQRESFECKKAISIQLRAIEDLKSSTTFTAKSLYQLECKVQLLNRELAYYNNLIQELF